MILSLTDRLFMDENFVFVYNSREIITVHSLLLPSIYPLFVYLYIYNLAIILKSTKSVGTNIIIH